MEDEICSVENEIVIVQGQGDERGRAEQRATAEGRREELSAS